MHALHCLFMLCACCQTLGLLEIAVFCADFLVPLNHGWLWIQAAVDQAHVAEHIHQVSSAACIQAVAQLAVDEGKGAPVALA